MVSCVVGDVELQAPVMLDNRLLQEPSRVDHWCDAGADSSDLVGCPVGAPVTGREVQSAAGQDAGAQLDLKVLAQ